MTTRRFVLLVLAILLLFSLIPWLSDSSWLLHVCAVLGVFAAGFGAALALGEQ